MKSGRLGDTSGLGEFEIRRRSRRSDEPSSLLDKPTPLVDSIFPNFQRATWEMPTPARPAVRAQLAAYPGIEPSTAAPSGRGDSANPTNPPITGPLPREGSRWGLSRLIVSPRT